MSNTSIKDILAKQALAAGNGQSRPRPSIPPGGQSGPPQKPSILSGPAMVAPLPGFCTRIAEAVPYTLRGDDRINYLIEELDKVPDDSKTELRILFENFLLHMLKLDASDLDYGGHAAKGRIWLRRDGDKAPDATLGEYKLDETNLMILNVLSATQKRILLEERSVDLSYMITMEDGSKRRFRSTIYFDYDQLAQNLRAIADEIRSLQSLNFHPLIQKGLMFKHERDGLTIVTGVTGSGKSTTLDAIIDANNKDFQGHIVVISKPIEYFHESKKCIVRNREVGIDTKSFKAGIVQSLRQDPDIVVIGELRDPETISASIEITDSGHKVFSTLHTSSAVESIDRVIGEYPTNEQNRIRNRLADVLRCVISQKLCPKNGGGRVLAKEVLWMTSSARAAIKNGNLGEIYQMMWEGRAEGMTTLEQDLARLLKENKITRETAMDFANNKKRMKQLLG